MIFRYSATARRKATLLLGVGILVSLGLLAALVLQWSKISIGIRIFSGGMLVLLVFTLRSQWSRLRFSVEITEAALLLHAPLSERRLPWATVQTVRRIALPQFSGGQRWACSASILDARGRAVPLLLFDNELENAEAALAAISARTGEAPPARP